MPIASQGDGSSGAITHNLRELDRSAIDAPPSPFAAQFDGWMRERVEEADMEALLDYRARAPEAVRNHPTDEHLMPFYVALGAGMSAADAFPEHRLLHTATTYGALAMTAFAFGAACRTTTTCWRPSVSMRRLT